MGFFDVLFLAGTHRDLRSLSRVAQLSEEVQHRKLCHVRVAHAGNDIIPDRRLSFGPIRLVA